MPTATIDQLAAASSASPTDLLEVSQGGVSRAMTFTQLFELAAYSLESLLVGTTDPGMDDVAIDGRSNSTTGVRGESVTGTGVRGLSDSGFASHFTGSSSAGALVERAGSNTDTTLDALELRGGTSGTPAAGYGVRVRYKLKSSTTAAQLAAEIAASWATATHASRAARLTISVFDSADTAREAIRVEASGSAALLGFYGATAAAKPAASGTNIGAGTVSLLSALATLGLVTNSVTGTDTLELGSTSGNSNTTINGLSDSGIGVRGEATSGTGVRAISSTGNGAHITAASAAPTLSERTGSNTNTVLNALELRGSTSGTPAAGYGVRTTTTLKSSTTTNQSASEIATSWTDATHATRKARLALSAYDSANTAREGLRIEADGSAARVGFFGGTAVVKPTVTGSRGGNAALASLLTALANLGLITDSTSA